MVKKIQKAFIALVLTAFAGTASTVVSGECILEAHTGNGRTPICLIVLKENEFAFFKPNDPESFKEYGERSSSFFEDSIFFGYRSEISTTFQEAVDRFPRLPKSFERSRKLSGVNVRYIIGRNVLKGCRVEFMNSENRILVYANIETKANNPRIPMRIDTNRFLVSDFELNGRMHTLNVNFSDSSDIRLPEKEYHKTLDDTGDHVKNIQVQVATNSISADSSEIRFVTDKLLRSVQFEKLTIPNVCLSEGPAAIGWGLLQRFDFALNFDEAPTMEILGSVNDHDCTQVLFGDFASNLEESGIRIGTIFSDYWSVHLKPGDLVVKADGAPLRGWMMYEIKKRMRTIQKNGGTLTVLRDNVEIEIRLPPVD